MRFLIPSSTGILLLNVHRLHKKKSTGDGLPAVVTIFRGYNANNPRRWDGFSWTPDQDVAQFFANRRPEEGVGVVVSAEITKDRICAVLLQRGSEVEYIVTDVRDDEVKNEKPNRGERR